MHDDLVALVDKMLDLNKRLEAVSEPCNERDSLQHEISLTDREIDNLVYRLYDLTEEEIAIVEGRGAPTGEQKCPLTPINITAAPSASRITIIHRQGRIL